MNTTTTNETTEECIERCNKLLRGERSAVETYRSAIEKYPDHPVTGELEAICEEHMDSVNLLEQSIRDMGGNPDMSSGAWGVFANAVQQAANLFGEESAIENLQNGEEKGADDYRDAIESGELMPNCEELYRDILLPRIEKHLKTLDRLEDVVDS